MEEKTIGTKVRVVTEEGEKNTMSEKDYTIIRIINYKDAHDWCDHYIVRGDDGEEKEIKQYECVFPPKESKYEDCIVHDFLDDNGVWAEVYAGYNGLPVVGVSIHWGDWKHEHGATDYLMQLLGYGKIGEKLTEEDGSDCYSSEHYYIKARA